MSKQRVPGEYLYVDKEGKSWFKRYGEKKQPRDIDPYTLASTPVLFSKEATVRSIFNLVKNNKLLQCLCFYTKEFLEESEDKPEFDLKGTLHFSYWSHEKDDNCININYPKLEVYGKDEKGELFGIEFLNSKELMNLSLSFDLTQKIVNEAGITLYQIDLWPTVFQVVYGLFWELSFFGNPKDREEESKKLKEIIKSLEKEGI